MKIEELLKFIEDNNLPNDAEVKIMDDKGYTRTIRKISVGKSYGNGELENDLTFRII